MEQNLHHAGELPDWEKVHPEAWNGWQRLAAETGGIVTPANVVSAMGHLAAITSVLVGRTTATRAGGFLAARSLDAIDGSIADKTGTKSQFGAGVDAVGDKFAIGAATIAGIVRNEIPRAVGVGIAANGLLRSGITIARRGLTGSNQKPSLAGKWAAAAESVAVTGHTALSALNRYPRVTKEMAPILRVVDYSALALGGIATVGYARDLWRARKQQKAKNTAEPTE